jgi:5-methyltetrahydrofolate--homocysteine methyltransferase
MPKRKSINLSFLSMAIATGLSSAIIDPTAEGVAETILASDFLKGKDLYGRRYLRYYRLKSKRK